MTITKCQRSFLCIKIKLKMDLIISVVNIKKIRQALPGKVSQRKLADMLQMEGLDLDKNAIQKIESGERFVTDIEIRIFAKVLQVSFDELLNQ